MAETILSMSAIMWQEKKQQKVLEMAKTLEQILDMGEQRIRVLEKKAQSDLDRGKEFTR